MGVPRRLPEGSATETVYGLIRDGRLEECVAYLEPELASSPNSRPALSLLGYCHYRIGNFDAASAMYDRLSRAHPEEQSYRLYHAQSLFRASARQDATRVASAIDDPALAPRVAQLRACAAFEEGDTAACRSFLDQMPADDLDAVVNRACCDLKDGNHEEARAALDDATRRGGFAPDVAFDAALCHYEAGQFAPALRRLAEIVERVPNPKAVGAVTDGVEVRSVGMVSCGRRRLAEALNPKAFV